MRLLLILALLAVPALAAAEIYKWVDDRGNVGFADDLGRVPAKYRDKATVTEKLEQAVEVLEKTEPEKNQKKGADAGGEKIDDKAKPKDKEKPQFSGKDGQAWKQDFARLKSDLKALEDQSAGIRERLADSSKLSRGDVLSLQATQRDIEFRLGKARQKINDLNAAADAAGVPGEFR